MGFQVLTNLFEIGNKGWWNTLMTFVDKGNWGFSNRFEINILPLGKVSRFQWIGPVYYGTEFYYKILIPEHMKKIYSFIVILLIVISCNVNEKEKQEESDKKFEKQRVDSINQKFKEVISEVTFKYNVRYKWDTLSFKYSYEYLPVVKSTYQIIEHFIIEDIYLNDTTYTISLHVGKGNIFYSKMGISIPSFNLKLSISKGFIKQITDKQKMNCLLVEIDTLYKINTSLFRGRGRIIEIFSIKK